MRIGLKRSCIMVAVAVSLPVCSCARTAPASSPSSATGGASTNPVVGTTAAVPSTANSGSAGQPTPATATPGPPNFASVEGYSYNNAGSSVVAALQKATGALDGVSKPTIRGVKGSDTGNTIGTLAVVALAPDYDADAEIRTSYVSGIASSISTGSGFTPKVITVNGQPAAQVVGKDARVVVWYVKGTIALLVSTQPLADVLSFAEAYSKAAS